MIGKSILGSKKSGLGHFISRSKKSGLGHFISRSEKSEQGKFIVLEGQGFTGKTVQAPLLVEKLKEAGIEAVVSNDTGGINETIPIREEILSKRAKGELTPKEEVELFYKSRKLQLEKFTKPNLKKGIWVISNRFSPSTFIYQGVEGGEDIDEIAEIDKKVVGDFKPDLYILLDVSPDKLIKRLTTLGARRKHSFNELNGMVIKSRREAYLKFAEQNSNDNWIVIDGNGPIDKVHQKIWEAVSDKFNLK